ncbi:bifunctional folylpolyglutamate synthase/dihydrofolate synthase [Zavarzinia compransoris]|uniref:Dihydrofolate synthase/folylpolyglutamate synthase n=1 Tax=Zavarzinia compransoris TaxID=1264899 RepID=A0A317DV34_9PROT|nr:Mur ligase family protein [Zavarzinia compransoris]PWR17726.1 bifunctional folylpolyglutamate synthase/dihydrofolate synthase [Zavarzinia compransoris]TDP49249.1 dihydrofolate synthase/folylpolyglutamate synthase [Zavarzinia compransoris]
MTTSDLVLERLTRLHPKKIDLSLGRMERLLARLGHPERQLPPVVHVAGTNGKGSTVAYLRAMAEAAGLKVHAYTSPHLVRFNERIRLAGSLIAEEALTALLEECERANGEAPITFFEVTTAAALLAFARTPADLLLLEVGLGGRLDATNVVTRPRVAVITPVDLDHKEFLGSTVAAIAGEKAGIMKPDVPTVLGPQSREALEVFCERADLLDAPLLVAGADFTARRSGDGFTFTGAGRTGWALPRPALPGNHQIENAATAVAAALLLDLPEAAITAGLTAAEWPARLQRLTRGPLVRALPAGGELWLDGGHNPHAARALAAALEELAADGRPLALVSGLISTKDAAGYFGAFAGLQPPVVAVTIPDEAAARPAADIAAAAAAAGLAAETAPDLAAAVTLAAALAGERARVLICGSLYLAGKVLAENG